MTRTYEQKMRDYRMLCLNHAAIEFNTMLFCIDSPDATTFNNVSEAGRHAMLAAHWVFEAYPDLREE